VGLLLRRLRNSNLSIWQSHRVVDAITGHRRLIFDVRELRRRSDTTTPDVINELKHVQGVIKIEWREGAWKIQKIVIIQAQGLFQIISFDIASPDLITWTIILRAAVITAILVRALRPWPRGDQALRCAVNRLISVILAAIVLIVAVSMGIGASLLGYPLWAIPLIVLLGACGAIVAIRVLS